MIIKPGANIQGIDIRMRPALVQAERIWKQFGQDDGVTVTSGLDGTHSAGSLHYYGLAVDFRTRYWSPETSRKVWSLLREQLKAIDSNFDVIYHKSHIHVEYDEK